MSRKVPIEGLVPIDDPHYRYKRPALQVKLEGRGNGKKTVILNIAEVAKALHRNPAELCKFLSSGMSCGGAGFAADKGTLTVTGHHVDTDMEECVKKYIQDFVLCPECTRPETWYRRKGKKTLMQRCDACGTVSPVGDDPSYESFNKWVLRQEGEHAVLAFEDVETNGTSKHKDKEKKAKKKDKKDKDDKKEKRKNRDKDSNGSPREDGSEEGGDETSNGDAGAAAEDNGDGNGELNIDDAIDVMTDYLANRPPPALVTIELRNDTNDPHEQLQIIVESVLTKEEVLAVHTAKSLPALKAYLGVVTPVVEAVNTRWLIAVVEHLFAVRYADLPKNRFPLVLHQLYELDLADEDELLAWAAEDGRVPDVHPDVTDEQLGVLKKASAKFIEWLQEAEEEDDNEDDEGSEDDA